MQWTYYLLVCRLLGESFGLCSPGEILATGYLRKMKLIRMSIVFLPCDGMMLIVERDSQDQKTHTNSGDIRRRRLMHVVTTIVRHRVMEDDSCCLLLSQNKKKFTHFNPTQHWA